MKKSVNLLLVSMMVLISTAAFSASKKAPKEIDPNDTAANVGETAVREGARDEAPIRGADGGTPSTTTTTLVTGGNVDNSANGELGGATDAAPRPAAAAATPGEKPAPARSGWVPRSQDVLTMTTCGNQKICIGLAKRGGYAKLGDEVFCEPKDGKCPSVEDCVRAKTSMVVHRPNNFSKVQLRGAGASSAGTAK